MTWIIRGLVAATIVIGVHTASGADTASVPGSAESRQSPSNDLEEIIVTAERKSESLERTPVTISALTSEALQKQDIYTQQDLQSAVAGLTVRATDSQNDTNFSLRGQSVDAYSGSSSAVVPYFNEVEVPSIGGALPLYDLQSIQVLKGPQGTLFGRNTTGGAVLFSSPMRPTDQFGGYVRVGGGDYGHQLYTGAINLPAVNDMLLVRIAAFHEYRDGYVFNLYNHSREGTVDRSGARASVELKLSDALRNETVLDLSHSGGNNQPNVVYSVYPPGSTNHGIPLSSTTSVLFSPALDAAIGFPGAWATYLAANPGAYAGGLDAFVALQKRRGPYRVDENSGLQHDANGLLLSNITSYDLAEATTIKNIFGFARSSARDGTDYDGTPFSIEGLGPASPNAAGSFDTERIYSEELQVVGKALDSQLDYVAGLFFSNDKKTYVANAYIFDLSPIIPESVEPLNALSQQKTYAGYAQGTYDLSRLTSMSGLGVVAGIRYTSVQFTEEPTVGSQYYHVPGQASSLEKTFTDPSWQVGLNEQLNPNMLLYVVSRHSFRSGGINYISPQIEKPASGGGAVFEPEVTTDVEVGAKTHGIVAAMPYQLNVAAYRQWIKDVQRTTYVAIPGAGISALSVNIPQAVVQGVEADFRINPIPMLALGGNIAYTNGVFTENQSIVFGQLTTYGPFPDTPRWTGVAFAEISPPWLKSWGDLSFRGDVYLRSSSYFSSTANTTTPGTQLPGYGVANFRVELSHVANTNLSLAASVHNAFDQTYYVGGLALGTILGLNAAQPGEPRTVFGELTYKF